jgi:hypothetical protein
MGGFKTNNGPPRIGKGPVSNEKDLESSNKVFPSRPTQAGRIKPRTELISKAMRCLENNDKDCIIKMLEELIKADCHNGYAVGREIADKVKDLVHDLWLVSDNEYRCRLLRILRDLDVSRNWVRDALGMNTKSLNKWLVRCNIDRESRMERNNVVEEIEDLLRRLGWSEVKMCEEMWRFVGVDVNAFRKYGIEPCIWLNGLETLGDLRRPYWLGLRASDLSIKHGRGVELILKTTNSIDAVFFPVLLSMIKMPSLIIAWKRAAPTAKYVHKSIALSFYIDLGNDEWPWPTELDVNELERILNSLSNEELAEFIAALLDGDGAVWYEGTAYVRISACKGCPKRATLDVLKEIIARRFGIIGNVYQLKTTNVLMFRGRNAVRLLRRMVKYVHHPLRRLRIELILAYRDKRISREVFEEFYEQIEYERGKDDVKRNRGLKALTQAAPQTHTHGVNNL